MITITTNAAKHIQEYLYNRRKGIGIRLKVKPSGCSGFMYEIETVDEEPDLEFEHIFETNDVTVYVDNKSFMFVDGTVLDYVKEGLNEGFKFENPNAAYECGCGESFSV